MLKAFTSKGYIETRIEKQGTSTTIKNTIPKKINTKLGKYIKFIFEDMPF